MTGRTRVGANVIDLRLIGKTVADDDAGESIVGQLDAGAACVGGGAKDSGANSLADHELSGGFTGTTILVDRQDHQIKVRLVDRLRHALEDGDVVRRGQRGPASVGE